MKKSVSAKKHAIANSLVTARKPVPVARLASVAKIANASVSNQKLKTAEMHRGF